MRVRAMHELGPRGQSKRLQILAAARELFLERGYEGTSMEAIRERAAVSKPTLYGHSEGKEQLFAAVVAKLAEEVAGDWTTGPALGDPAAPLDAAGLTAHVTAFCRRASAGVSCPEHVALLRVVVAEAPRHPEIGRLFVEAGPRRAIAELTDLLTRARDQGLARVPDVPAAARMLLGALLAPVVIDRLLDPGAASATAGESTDARADAVAALFLAAITRQGAMT